MTKRKTGGKWPQLSRAQQRKAHTAPADASEPQAKRSASSAQPPTALATGLPLAKAITIFATDADKSKAAEFTAARKREREEVKQKHHKKAAQLDAEIKRFFGDRVADPNFGRDVALHKL